MCLVLCVCGVCAEWQEASRSSVQHMRMHSGTIQFRTHSLSLSIVTHDAITTLPILCIRWRRRDAVWVSCDACDLHLAGVAVNCYILECVRLVVVILVVICRILTPLVHYGGI